MQNTKKGIALLVGGWALALCALCAQAQTVTSSRVSSFEYDANGLLVREIVEPDRPNDCISTTYTYDARGNKATASTSACAGASGDAIASATAARTSRTDYNAQTVVVAGVTYTSLQGQFPTQSTNVLLLRPFEV